MIKALIFDFFGVIVGDGFDMTYKTAGGDLEKDKTFVQNLLDQTNRSKITTDEFRAKICQKLGISVEQYQESIKQAEKVNQELLAYIGTLRPRYKTAILSNVNKGGLERRVDRKVLDELFDVIIVSGDVGYIKPEPEIYKLVAGRLGVKMPECVFIDDRPGYIEAASALGMKVVHYKNFEQLKKDLEELLSPVVDK